jgi:DNA-binding NarL/FixJ family response regulator
MAEKIGVLVVDDQQLVREGLHVLLDLIPDIEVIGEAGDGSQAVTQVKKLHPDVVLMDIQMPVMDGVAATRQLHEECPEVKVIILTTFDDDEYVFEGLLAGAAGYMLKDVHSEQLADSIRAAAQGKAFIHPAVTQKVVSQLSRLTKRERVRQEQPLEAPLSSREIEVLALLAQGHSNREITEKLCIAPGTVKNHVNSIYSKLGVHDRTQAVLKAKQLGLV